VYGLWDSEETHAKALLDACNGHYGPVPANAEYGIVTGGEVYHYHTTDTPPYIVGCYGPVKSLKQCSKLYQGCSDPEYQTTLYQSDGTAFNYQLWCPCFQHEGNTTDGNCLGAGDGCAANAGAGGSADKDNRDPFADWGDWDNRIPDWDKSDLFGGGRFNPRPGGGENGNGRDEDGFKPPWGGEGGRKPVGECKCKSDDCSGHGVCDKRGCNTTAAIARCKCDESWLMADCALDQNKISDRLGEFGREMMDKLKKFQNATKQQRKCSDPAKPIFCDIVFGSDSMFGRDGNKHQCVENLRDCFNSSLGMDDFRKEGSKRCGDEQIWCDRDGCITKGEVCSPVSVDCPTTKPFRCTNWKCVDLESSCKVSSTCQGKTLCPDGRCKPNLTRCAAKMTWEGCLPGTSECQQKKGLCAKTNNECQLKTGCLAGLVSCGTDRNKTNGAPIIEEYIEETGLVKWRIKLECQKSCKNKDGGSRLEPMPVIKPLIAAVAGKMKGVLEVKAKDSERVAMKIEVKSESAFRRLDGATDSVRFSVQPVPQSLHQEGSFREYHKHGTLMSLMSVEPADLIELLPGKGLELQFALPDDASVDVNLRTCSFLVAGMQVLSVDDITNLEEKPAFVDHCSPVLFRAPGSTSDRGNCSCAVNVTHFTTFGTVDSEADEMMQREDGVTCKSCPASRYNSGCSSSDVGTCSPCPAGTQSPPGSLSIEECQTCPANEYSMNSAESFGCKSCPSPTISPAGSTSLEACTCPEGMYKNTQNNECATCDAGKYKGASDTECQDCDAGKYSLTVRAVSWETCENCPVNSNSAAASNSASDCKCDAGYTELDATCTACVPGKYKESVGACCCMCMCMCTCTCMDVRACLCCYMGFCVCALHMEYDMPMVSPRALPNHESIRLCCNTWVSLRHTIRR